MIMNGMIKQNKRFIDELIKYEEDCVCQMKRERSVM